MTVDKDWVRQAIRAIHADMHRSADTHLLRFPLAPKWEEAGLSLYLKDESTHPTGSLKHRLARSLFLYALCNGKIAGPDTPVYEASSGSTAISEAYFARFIGLRNFSAVVPARTSAPKLRLVADYGGRVVATDADVIGEAHRLAEENHGYFLDQFTFAERATDWRGNNNIAETIYTQLEREPEAARIPRWVVCGAGTGGTSATIGRYIRYNGYATRVCVVDPHDSAYFDRWAETKLLGTRSPRRFVLPSAIEGIGRPVPADSFLPEVIDAMVCVPNEASVGAMRYLFQTGMFYCGVSTGTNLIGAIRLLERMWERGESGSVVTLICDSGLRYQDTYYSPDWLAAQTYPDGTFVFPASATESFRSAVQSFVEQGIRLSSDLLSDCLYEEVV